MEKMRLVRRRWKPSKALRAPDPTLCGVGVEGTCIPVPTLPKPLCRVSPHHRSTGAAVYVLAARKQAVRPSTNPRTAFPTTGIMDTEERPQPVCSSRRPGGAAALFTDGKAGNGRRWIADCAGAGTAGLGELQARRMGKSVCLSIKDRRQPRDRVLSAHRFVYVRAHADGCCS